MGRKHHLRDRCTLREVPDLRRCPLRVKEGYHDAPFMTTIRKLTKWDAYNLDTEWNNNKTSLITFKEDNPLVVASQPPQRFLSGVWNNNFSSADIHGMNANMVQIANQQNSIQIKKKSGLNLKKI